MTISEVGAHGELSLLLCPLMGHHGLGKWQRKFAHSGLRRWRKKEKRIQDPQLLQRTGDLPPDTMPCFLKILPLPRSPILLGWSSRNQANVCVFGIIPCNYSPYAFWKACNESSYGVSLSPWWIPLYMEFPLSFSYLVTPFASLQVPNVCSARVTFLLKQRKGNKFFTSK